MTVGECHSNLTDAVDDLKATHGKTQWILQILKGDLEKKTQHRAWGSNNTL